MVRLGIKNSLYLMVWGTKPSELELELEGPGQYNSCKSPPTYHVPFINTGSFPC